MTTNIKIPPFYWRSVHQPCCKDTVIPSWTNCSGMGSLGHKP